MDRIRLDSFRDFLESRKLSYVTTTSYVSWVRKLLHSHHCGGQEPTAEQAIAYEAELDRPYASIFRSAWRRYAEFIGQPEGNFPDRRSKALRVATAKAEHPMQLAIAMLVAKIRPTMIEQMTWKAIFNAGNGRVWLQDLRHNAYEFPLEDIQRLRVWAAPATKDAPLIPDAPGSLVPLSAFRIRGAVRPASLK